MVGGTYFVISAVILHVMIEHAKNVEQDNSYSTWNLDF